MVARKRSSKPAVPTDDLDDIEEDLDVTDELEDEEEAPKPKRSKVTPAKKTARKPVKKVVEEEAEDDEEEDDEEEEVVVKKPAKKAATKKAAPKAKTTDDDALGTAWLVEHVNETLGTEHPATAVRVVLRRLAKNGKLDREVGETRSRYAFTGPTDPVVKAVVKAIKDGAIKADRDEKLGALKAKKASKKAVEVEDDDVEDLEEDE